MLSCSSLVAETIEQQRSIGEIAFRLSKNGKCEEFENALGRIESDTIRDAVYWLSGVSRTKCVSLDEMINVFYYYRERGDINTRMIRDLSALILNRVSKMDACGKERSFLLAEDLLESEKDLLDADIKVRLIEIVRRTVSDDILFIRYLNRIWSEGKMDGKQWNKVFSKYRRSIREASHLHNVKSMILNGYGDVVENAIDHFVDDRSRGLLRKAMLISRGMDVSDTMALVADSGGNYFLTLVALECVSDLSIQNRYDLIFKMRSDGSFASDLLHKHVVSIVRDMIGSNEDIPPLYKLLEKVYGLNGIALIEHYIFISWVAMEVDKCNDIAISYLKKALRLHLPPVLQSKVYYWLGRGYYNGGNVKEARRFYSLASQNPFSFYGQLSLRELGFEPSIVASNRLKELKLKFGLCNVLPTNIMAELGYLAYRNSDRWGAVQYFEDGLRSMGNKGGDVCYLKNILLSLNGHSSYYFGKKAALWNMPVSDISFPIIDMNKSPLINAIIRQESGFMNMIDSPRGAVGMMQIRPYTAKFIASNIDIPFSSEMALMNKLRDDRYNLAIGQEFLRQLHSRYKNVPLSIAAYNAGSGRVSSWIARFGNPGVDLHKVVNWIESIPYKETRDYVIAVLEAKIVYDGLSLKNDVRKVA